jgi:hypothetical protein
MYEETGTDNNGNLRMEKLAHTVGTPFSVDRSFGYDTSNLSSAKIRSALRSLLLQPVFVVKPAENRVWPENSNGPQSLDQTSVTSRPAAR